MLNKFSVWLLIDYPVSLIILWLLLLLFSDSGNVFQAFWSHNWKSCKPNTSDTTRLAYFRLSIGCREGLLPQLMVEGCAKLISPHGVEEGKTIDTFMYICIWVLDRAMNTNIVICIVGTSPLVCVHSLSKAVLKYLLFQTVDNTIWWVHVEECFTDLRFIFQQRSQGRIFYIWIQLWKIIVINLYKNLALWHFKQFTGVFKSD